MPKLYKISVSYVDFPMGASPEYDVSSGHTKEEAEAIVEEKLQDVDKNPEKYACNNPHYFIREMETA